jgi:hypothetical protein
MSAKSECSMMIFFGVCANAVLKQNRMIQILIKNRCFFKGLIFAKFKKKEVMLLQIKIYLLIAIDEFY